MRPYTITMILHTEEESPKEAARYFSEFVKDWNYCVNVEDDETGEKYEIDTRELEGE